MSKKELITEIVARRVFGERGDTICPASLTGHCRVSGEGWCRHYKLHFRSSHCECNCRFAVGPCESVECIIKREDYA